MTTDSVVHFSSFSIFLSAHNLTVLVEYFPAQHAAVLTCLAQSWGLTHSAAKEHFPQVLVEKENFELSGGQKHKVVLSAALYR